MFRILNEEPTVISDKWSHAFQDFVKQCCCKDPEKRASCDDLTMHPFLDNAENCLRSYKAEFIKWKNTQLNPLQ